MPEQKHGLQIGCHSLLREAFFLGTIPEKEYTE